MKLSEQVVLVTGSSRGLGAAIVRAFHKEGARVVINYCRSRDAALRLCGELNEEPSSESRPRAVCVQADITKSADVQRVFAHAESSFSHPVTTVVNNALVGSFSFNGDQRKKLSEIEWHDFDIQLRGAVQGALNTTQAALPSFERLHFGRIVNIGSNLTFNPVVPYQDYTTAKGALLAFTRTTAAELGPLNVTVNMVSGGLLRTTTASQATPEEVFEMIKNITPLRKVTTPEDVAKVVLFFAGELAGGVTGQNMNVDGGLVMG